MMPRPALISLMLLVGGCASSPDAATREAAEPTVIEETVRIIEPADPAKKQVCRMEKSTGSHMAHKRCFTPEEREHMSKESRDWLLSGGKSGATYEVRDPADPRE